MKNTQLFTEVLSKVNENLTIFSSQKKDMMFGAIFYDYLLKQGVITKYQVVDVKTILDHILGNLQKENQHLPPKQITKFKRNLKGLFDIQDDLILTNKYNY